MKLKKLKLNHFLIPLSFLLPLSIYIYTLCPTVSAYADAGEAPTFAHISGFIHPPGYPLFILIVKLFQLLPFGNPAFQANLAAAFFAAATIPLFYLLLKRLAKQPLIAFTASLILAFSKIYWHNALVSEVFSLLAFFIVLCLLLFHLWSTTKQKKYLFAFIITAGFGFFHHQTIIFILFPLFIYFLISKQWQLLKVKDYLLSLLCFFSGFLPYLYILLYAAPRQPPMNWNNPVTWSNLLQLFTRASFGTFRLTVDSRTVDFSTQSLGLLNILFQAFTWPLLILFILGCIYTLRKNLKILLLSITIILAVFIFTLFSGMPVNQSVQTQYLERFHLISSIFISLLIGFGLLYLHQLINRFNNRFIILTLSILLFLIPLFLLIHNYKPVNQNNNYFADQLAEDLFSSLPQDSIFIFGNDSIINTLFYYRYVLNQRQDISYIIGGIINHHPDWYIEEIKHQYPDIVLPDPSLNPRDYLLAFIHLNSLNRPVFFLIPNLEYQLNLNLFKIKHGLVWQFIDPNQTSLPSLPKLETELLNFLDQSHYLTNPSTFVFGSPEFTLTEYYSSVYIYLAQLNHQNLSKAEKYYTQAIQIYPHNFIALLELGDDYAMHNQPNKAITMWQQALQYIWDSNLKQSIQSRIHQYQKNLWKKPSSSSACL